MTEPFKRRECPTCFTPAEIFQPCPACGQVVGPEHTGQDEPLEGSGFRPPPRRLYPGEPSPGQDGPPTGFEKDTEAEVETARLSARALRNYDKGTVTHKPRLPWSPITVLAEGPDLIAALRGSQEGPRPHRSGGEADRGVIIGPDFSELLVGRGGGL